MKFNSKLIEGKLIRRYKRFLADVELDGEKSPILVHVPNSGSMKGCAEPGSLVRLTKSDNPNRKIPYTLEMVRAGKSWVGVNTSNPNKIVEEAFHSGLVGHWKDFDQCQREVVVSAHSRIDLKLSQSSGKKVRFVEIKNVSMALPPLAIFPDAKTERGLKHLKELQQLVKKGFQAEIFFLVQRSDCTGFDAAWDIDPEYGKELLKAEKNGVIVSCYSCELSNKEIRISLPLPPIWKR